MTYARCSGVSAAARRVRLRPVAPSVRVVVQADDAARARPASVGRAARRWRRAARGGAAVRQHVAQPLRGIVGVQRHVRAAGLEHGQQRRRPSPARAPRRSPTRTSGPTPSARQVVRQPVGARVQLRVGERLALEDHAPPRPASAPPAPRTARGCTAPRVRPPSVRFHSSSTRARSAAGSTSSSPSAPPGRGLQRLDQPLQRRVHQRAHPLAPRPAAATCAVSANASPRSSTDSASG